MVRVQRHEYIVLFRQDMGRFGENDRAKSGNWPPPVETWMMPSDLVSAKAFNAALIVTMDVMLTAG